MKLTPGKYKDTKFTVTQERARRIWQRSDKYLHEIMAALMTCNYTLDREYLHKRLDRRLDVIEDQRKTAKDLFPEVNESFTIYSGHIDL